MEQKNSNATLIVISLTVIIIVAMVCGMVMWIMQRTMAMNERLLEVQLQHQQPQVAQPMPLQQVQIAQPTPAAQPTPVAKPEPTKQPVKKPVAKPVTQKPEQRKVAAKPTVKKTEAKKPEVKKPEVKPEPKRLVPQETPEGRAKVGPDGLPLDRITLPVGNDDLDWQF